MKNEEKRSREESKESNCRWNSRERWWKSCKSDKSTANESALESESSGSVNTESQKRSVRSAYTLEKIRKFLQTTKGMKRVKVEDYFPDCELFSSARMLMREKDTNSFSDQEIFRLKKIGQKLNILNDEFEIEWIFIFLVGYLWLVCPCLIFIHSFMSSIRLGTLNINGARDSGKRAMLYELIRQKKYDVMFVQETHSDARNENDWKMEWDGEKILSNKSSWNGGVVVLFQKHFRPISYEVEHVVEGQLLKIRAKNWEVHFGFCEYLCTCSWSWENWFYKEVE